jgi:Aminoglycoside-2''-adenylyltransferase
MSAAEQLAALAWLHKLLERNRIEYWMFGGWAVDFHAGSVTRPHDDFDVAVWLKDYDRVAELLVADGWKHASEEGEDGYTRYERDTVRLELAFLARDEDGHVYSPLREGRAAWPSEAFENDVAELRGVRARVISLHALKADKSEVHDDPRVGRQMLPRVHITFGYTRKRLFPVRVGAKSAFC